MTTATNPATAEREAFEAWARPFYILDRTSDDKYEWQGAYIAWFAWQAARATQASAEPVDRHGQMTDAMRDFITGMSVSVDVSTGEDDAYNRLFGVVNEVMDCDGDKHGVTLLVYDATANFAAPSSAPSIDSAGEAKDAARYRYLRDGGDIYITPGDLAGDGDSDPVPACISGSIADEAIDRAIAAMQPQGAGGGDE